MDARMDHTLVEGRSKGMKRSSKRANATKVKVAIGLFGLQVGIQSECLGSERARASRLKS